MTPSLRQLRIFVAVADAGSTAAAAERVALSQSAASAALKELEDGLGIALFDRIGRRLRLNAAGRALLDEARAVLDGADGIGRRFGRNPDARGVAHPPLQARLGASTTIGNYLMPERIARLLATNPEARVELRIGNTARIAEAVRALELDLGLIEGPCHADGLQVLPWQDDELVVVAGHGHALAAGADIAALRRARWLLREPGSGTREAVEQALLPHLHGFADALCLGSTEAIKRGVAAGLGLACLSRHAVADMVESGRLCIVPTPLPSLHRQLSVVRHPGRRPMPDLLELLGLPATAFE